MADEINIQAALTVRRFSPALQASGTLDVDQSGTHAIANVQTVPSSGSPLDSLELGDIATLGYVFLKNLDMTNSVELSLDSNNPPSQKFANLKPNEFCILPVAPSQTIYVHASASTVDLMVVAAEA